MVDRIARSLTSIEPDLLRVDEQLERRLQDVIERHLPKSSKTWYSSQNDFGIRYSCMWASEFVSHDESTFSNLGLSKDVKNLEDILALQARLILKLKALSPDTRRALELRKLMVTGANGSSSLASTKSELQRIAALIKSLRKTPAYRTPAKGKRNWRAVNTAWLARRVWAQGNWEGPDPRQLTKVENIAYMQHLQNFAPISEKLDGPGPFGQFLEDIFFELGILSSVRRHI